MNKKGGFTDLFLFMIFAIIIVLISVVFVYMGTTVKTQLHNSLDNMSLHDTSGNNASVVIDNTVGRATASYSGLYWITVLLIVGMILSIWIGSYLVTTKPVFFVPYLFVTIIAVIVSVGISNAYETLTSDATLGGTFAGFVGTNFIMLNLPLWMSVIGFVGAIIMFARMGRKEEQFYYG